MFTKLLLGTVRHHFQISFCVKYLSFCYINTPWRHELHLCTSHAVSLTEWTTFSHQNVLYSFGPRPGTTFSLWNTSCPYHLPLIQPELGDSLRSQTQSSIFPLSCHQHWFCIFFRVVSLVGQHRTWTSTNTYEWMNTACLTARNRMFPNMETICWFIAMVQIAVFWLKVCH